MLQKISQIPTLPPPNQQINGPFPTLFWRNNFVSQYFSQ